jgi:hypothetical protein|nr:MAG TPA: hypothetical protein [Caudoviricetes sp.]
MEQESTIEERTGTTEQESLANEQETNEQESIGSEQTGEDEAESSFTSEVQTSEAESTVSEGTGATDSEGGKREITWADDLQVENDATVGGTLRAHKECLPKGDRPMKNGNAIYSTGAAYAHTPTHIGVDDSRHAEGKVDVTLLNADGEAVGSASSIPIGMTDADKAIVAEEGKKSRAYTDDRIAALGTVYIGKGDSVNYAQRAGSAVHADRAANLDSDSSDWKKIMEMTGGKYLRKDQDDETQYKLTMKEAEVKGDSTVGGSVKNKTFRKGYLDGYGYGMYLDGDKSVLEIDKLLVRMKAVFAELEIRKLSYVGGDMARTFAGSTLQRVVAVDAERKEITDGTMTADGYKCYFVDDDGTTRTQNWWKVGDQARCQTFNIEAGVHKDVSNRYYWRLVVATGTEDVVTGKDADGKDMTRHMGYVILSNRATGFYLKADGSYPTLGSDGLPVKGADGKYDALCYNDQPIVFVGMDGANNNDVPGVGDAIVQLGSQSEAGRSYAVMDFLTEQKTVYYYGINSYSLEGCAVEQHSPHGSFVYTKWFELRVGDPKEWHPLDNNRGAYDDDTEYYYYDNVSFGGSQWLHTGKSPTKGVKPGADSTVWTIITAGYDDSCDPELVVMNDSDAQLSWEDSCTLTCKVMQGSRDRTSEVTEWSVARKTGDSNADEIWAAKDKVRNFAGSLLLVTGMKEDDLGSGTEAKFVFKAKGGQLQSSGLQNGAKAFSVKKTIAVKK